MIKNQVVTVNLLFQNPALKRSSGKIYSIDRQSVLKFFCVVLGVTPNKIIVIGDGFVDIDMVNIADLGNIYRAPDEVQNRVDFTTNDLRSLFT